MQYLVATDGSEEGDEAVRYATRHATALGATLEIVHVITPETKLVGDELVVQDRATAAEKGRRTLQNATDLATGVAQEHEVDLDVETQLLTGRPADAIADHARVAEATAIYVGHRGLSNKQEEVVGSVAKSVVSKADVPVTVVR